MSRLAQLITLVALGLATPFAAWGLGADINATPETAVWSTGADAVFDLEAPPGLEPPECGLKVDGENVERTDYTCCWVFYFGRWWCIYC